jgi:hypothetical protein
MAEENEVTQPKIGAGHLAAMGRAGLKELSQALVALPDSNIRPIEEPGLAGNLTPQEIVHGKSQYESMLHGYAARGVEPQEQDRGMER